MPSILRRAGCGLVFVLGLGLLATLPAHAGPGSCENLRRLEKTDPRAAEACRAEKAGKGRVAETPSQRPSEPRHGRAARTPQPQSLTPAPGTTKTTTADGGQTVHDERLHVNWLADANYAAKHKFGLPINDSGSMDYATAVRWVQALNKADGGRGYLGHSNWTLPTTGSVDTTCSSHNKNSFGYNCLNSDLGSLYSNILGLKAPATAVPMPANKVGPITDLQPYLYWSETGNPSHPKNVNGYSSFSFATGFQGSNVDQNYLYVLPMIKGKASAGAPAGSAVYDPVADVTWLADANLAAKQNFGLASVNRDGSMDHKTALAWIDALKKANGGKGWLNQTNWKLPPTAPSTPSASCVKGDFGFGCTGGAMGQLFYGYLKRKPGDSVVVVPDVRVGPFHNIQPYLYWSCERDPKSYACNGAPASGFQWSFSFGNGFQGTDVVANQLYVMVYFPEDGPKSSGLTPHAPCGTRCK